jgi:hypothetical protein
MSATMLFDWIVSEKSVGDNGNWMSSSATPIAYDKKECIVMTADKRKFYVFPQDMCKAANVHVKSAQVLSKLPDFQTSRV